MSFAYLSLNQTIYNTVLIAFSVAVKIVIFVDIVLNHLNHLNHLVLVWNPKWL
jgi:hypothetical protein